MSGGRDAILLAERATGLLLAVRFPDRTDAATFKREAANGVFVGCSVSMDGNEMRTTLRAGMRTITDAGPLLEISLVSTACQPAYDNTWVMSTDDNR